MFLKYKISANTSVFTNIFPPRRLLYKKLANANIFFLNRPWIMAVIIVGAVDGFWRLIIADQWILFTVCHDDARDWTLTELSHAGKGLTM
jgi:hypothetical protein